MQIPQLDLGSAGELTERCYALTHRLRQLCGNKVQATHTHTHLYIGEFALTYIDICRCQKHVLWHQSAKLGATKVKRRFAFATLVTQLQQLQLQIQMQIQIV